MFSVGRLFTKNRRLFLSGRSVVARRRMRDILLLWLVAWFAAFAGPVCCCRAQGTGPFEEASAPLTPANAAKQFKVADSLAIGVFAAEPQVSHPLLITFDDRGRMWVLQYRQFPNPNGLKPVHVDNWLRTQYDKLPEPPPQGPKGPQGHDRISVYEDTDGNGRADTVKEFLSDLNLASGMALGYGGVFVVQSPYLLYYADRNQDDVPDAGSVS